jgi:Septum formation
VSPVVLLLDGNGGRRRSSRWTALAVAAVAGATALVGCSDDDGTGVLELGEMGPGTCLMVTDELGEEVSSLPVVDCVEDHTHEIFAAVEWEDPEAVFPGTEALDAKAEEVCVRDFEPYVGVSAFDSRLNFTWLTPTLGSWNDHDDRTVLCVLANPDGAPLIGSMRDARI